MIVCSTPLRISFCGGGTDLREFYSKESGCVVSTAINKSVYLASHENFEQKFLLKYRQTEEVSDVAKIAHPLFREILKKFTPPEPLEITSMADIPATGSGLGSSSAFTVGLINLMARHKNLRLSHDELAGTAAHIEIDILKTPIGKQDHYASAFGGLNYIQFNSDESVKVEPIHLSKSTLAEFQNGMSLFFTGITRSSSEVLSEQKLNTSKGHNAEHLRKMKQLAIETRDALKAQDITKFGELLNMNWQSKKQLASSVSNPLIDSMIDKGLAAGALGAKLLGAGAGGFVFFFSNEEKKPRIRAALKGFREVPFAMDFKGSRIVYDQL